MKKKVLNRLTAELCLLLTLITVGVQINAAHSNEPTPSVRAFKTPRSFGIESFLKYSDFFSDPKIPRSKRVDQFEKMISEVVQKSNELSENLEPRDVEKALPLFELKAILVEISIEKVRLRECNSIITQVLNASGTSAHICSDLKGANRFVCESLEKVCN